MLPLIIKLGDKYCPTPRDSSTSSRGLANSSCFQKCERSWKISTHSSIGLATVHMVNRLYVDNVITTLNPDSIKTRV